MRGFEVIQPRGFGWLLGDRLERRIEFDLRAPYRLEREALPAAGRHGDWLTLAPPRVETHGDGTWTHYVVHLVYQLVNVDARFQDITVPHHELVYTDGTTRGKVLVPATRVGVSMLRAPGHDELRPAQAPARVAFDSTRATLCGGLALAALAVLAWLRFGLPRGRTARPFATAARELAQLPRDNPGEHYGEALRVVHRAFNATAGGTVFVETLDAFFADHARYAPLRVDIETCFADSRRYFFEGRAHADTAAALAALTTLVARCRDLERGLR